MHLDRLAFLKVVDQATAILYQLEFDHLRVVTTIYFYDKFARLERAGFVFGLKFFVQLSNYFKRHKRIIL